MKIGSKVLVKKSITFRYGQYGHENERKLVIAGFPKREMFVVGICTKFEGRRNWMNREVGYIFVKSKGHRLYECRQNIKDRQITLVRKEDLEIVEEPRYH